MDGTRGARISVQLVLRRGECVGCSHREVADAWEAQQLGHLVSDAAGFVLEACIVFNNFLEDRGARAARAVGSYCAWGC